MIYYLHLAVATGKIEETSVFCAVTSDRAINATRKKCAHRYTLVNGTSAAGRGRYAITGRVGGSRGCESF